MHSNRLVVSPAAREDLQNIYQFGLQQWGSVQAGSYLDGIKALLWRLTEQPHMGIERAELLPAMRSFAVERHVVFYRYKAPNIEIVRILHGRQDPKFHLK